MIIEAVRIRLFGKAVNKDYGPISPGLTVCYGENESGKTTLKEFVRTTLFKTGKRKNVYPQTSNSDSGEIDCVTDTGKRFTVTRSGSKIVSSIGLLPSDISGVDPDIYRSVYAMGPEDLIDTDAVESGDIKRRFLTVPGGENMPHISESINVGMEDLLRPEKMTAVKGIGKLFDDISENGEAIKAARSKGPEYERLASAEARINAELSALKDKKAEADAVRANIDAYEKQEGNLKEYGELEMSLDGMADADRAPPEGMERYRELAGSEVASRKRMEGADEGLAFLVREMGGASPAAVMRNEEKIRSLNESIGSYLSATSAVEVADGSASRLGGEVAALMGSRLNPETVRNADTGRGTIERASVAEMPKKNYVPVLALLALAAVCAMAAFVSGIPYIYAASVSALAAIYFVLPKRVPEDGFSDFIASRGFPGDTRREEVAGLCEKIDSIRALEQKRDSELRRASDMRSEIARLESELESISSEAGIGRASFESDVRRLNALITISSAISEAKTTADEAGSGHRMAKSALEGYLEPYGSAEELERIVALKKKRDETRNKMESIRNIMGSAGIDTGSEAPLPPDDPAEEIEEKQRELGKIIGQKEAILKDADTERLLDARSSLRAELDSEIRRWGVLSLERYIADTACDDIYENMQPQVIQTADRYLEMMTGGLYRMESNPRTKDVSIRGGTEVKAKGQWSSGLAGQVCLSLKLAVAKELSEEKLPILLDDVLLVFDSERKRGACRALSEAAKDMQIVFFTCDRETCGFMKQAGAEPI
jgi:multidrug resistance efflux pump